MRRILIPIAVLALTAAACGDDDAATTTTAAPAPTEAPAGDAAVITIADFDFGEPLTVSVGQTVTIVNEDGAPHTWTSVDGVFDSGRLAGGDEFTFVFEEPGTYDFFCEIHPSMTGTITVTG